MNAKTQHWRLEEDLGLSIVEPSARLQGFARVQRPQGRRAFPTDLWPSCSVRRFAFCEELWQVQPR